MITLDIYVLSNALFDVVLAVLAVVVVLYVAKWLLSFLPLFGT
jgi:hypothetical protein